MKRRDIVTFILVFLISSSFCWDILQASSIGAPIFRDELNSTVMWDKINPDDWLSFRRWEGYMNYKSVTPKSEVILRERQNVELVGRFIECVGKCKVHRRNGFFNAKYRSTVYEGDSVETVGESYAWIFLMDGTLVRLSPKSSVIFREINIGKEEIFLHAKIGYGNVLWLSRNNMTFKNSGLRETDTLFLPLNLYEANYFEEDYDKSHEDLKVFLKRDKLNRDAQYKRLNKLIEENNRFIKDKKSLSFVVLSNGTVFGKNLQMEFYSFITGRAYLKSRDAKAGAEKIKFYFRGLNNSRSQDIDHGQWYRVEFSGREVSSEGPSFKKFAMGELVTKRVPTILTARELFLKKYSKFIYDEKKSAMALAQKHGYRAWGNFNVSNSDMNKRMDFLKEYTQRIESLNISAIRRFKEKLLQNGGAQSKTRDDILFETGDLSGFYAKAINSYMQRPNKFKIFDFSYQNERRVDRDQLNSTKLKLWKRVNAKKKSIYPGVRQ